MTGRTRHTREAQRQTIDALDGPEAKRVLGALLDTRPDLLGEVAELAGSDLGGIDRERVADEVARTVGALRIEDAWVRSGPRADGSYVEETEAAWAVVEDAVEPFARDLERRIRLGRDAEARAICEGTLVGLYRVDRKYGEQFLDGHAPDAISDVAGWVAERWRKSGGRARPRRSRDRTALREFVSTALPEWQGFLIRTIGPEPKGRRRS